MNSDHNNLVNLMCIYEGRLSIISPSMILYKFNIYEGAITA
jgi:hypothetical protein